MNYLDLIKARRASGKLPSMKKRSLTEAERNRDAAGLCIACGRARQGVNSDLCGECEAGTTMEDIRRDLLKLRNQILKKHP